MAAFSSLTDRLSNAFKHLKSKGKLSEADIDGTIREIRRALLDADVALDVVRSFTGRIRERALGTEVSQALNPAQQVVKIVNEELTDVLGAGVDRPLNFAKNPPTIMMPTAPHVAFAARKEPATSARPIQETIASRI